MSTPAHGNVCTHTNTAVNIEEELRKCNNYPDYLNLLAQISKKYTVIIVTLDTPVGSGSTPELARRLTNIGTLIPLTSDKFRCAYAAIIDQGILVFEGISRTHAVKYETVLDGDIPVGVESVGFIGKEQVRCAINIDGVNYVKKKRGQNFVIYDKQKGKIIDRVSFDTYNNPPQCYREGVVAAILDN